MRLLAALSFGLSFATIAASPLPSSSIPSSITSILCRLPFLDVLCRRDPNSISVSHVVGAPTHSGVTRYVAKYATANRWSPPEMSTSWISSPNPTALPPVCPQSNVDPSQMSEDCLYVVLYVPHVTQPTPGGIPTIAWAHGGSFIIGGASDPALDGSNLAVATNSIVAVVQYRLGTLGLLPPSANSDNSNLALQDVVTALTYLRLVLPSFGGTPDTPQLTLAGQSSGASIIRALLGTPSALPLFNNAWLHSDTVDYGFLTSGALCTLREAWVAELGCSGICADTMDVETLIDHQNNLLNEAPTLGPEFYFSSPLRPSPDGQFIMHTLTSPSTFPPASELKPIVVTTVRNESDPTVYSFFPDSNGPISEETFEGFIVENLGQNRTETVLASPFYQFSGDVDLRTIIGTISTDGLWRCPNWILSKGWAAHGGTNQYTGLFTAGLTYSANQDIPECSLPGAVCHEDDIQVVFGTGPKSIPLTQEIQARYSAFIRTGIPNAQGYATWQTTTSSDTKTLNLGGQAPIPVGACVPTFWGDQVPFDYQVNHE